MYASYFHYTCYRCKAHNLRNTLNLHPASGIQKWEYTFDDMVKAMGLNSSSVRIIYTIIHYNETCFNLLCIIIGSICSLETC